MEKECCTNCLHYNGGTCGYYEDIDADEMMCDSGNPDDYPAFNNNCVGCCCGDCFECNKDNIYGACDNWEHVNETVIMG